MSHRTLSHSIFVLLGVAAFVGCSAEGVFSSDPEDSPSTDNSATLPPPSGGSSGGHAGGAAADGGKPAKADASVDAGPPPPAPGSACSTIDQIFERPCGACGKQQALCLAGADGGAGVVSD